MVNEDQIVFRYVRGVVYIHLFADDAIASGFAAYLIDVVNSFAGSYSLSHVQLYIAGVLLHATPATADLAETTVLSFTV
jgi:hypothetical protein